MSTEADVNHSFLENLNRWLHGCPGWKDSDQTSDMGFRLALIMS